MSIDMTMPQMGESITVATISRWLKQPGDAVKKDEALLEITTDKVDSEIPAPADGILAEVFYNDGDEVPVNSKIAVIDDSAQASSEPAKPQAASEPDIQKEQADDIPVAAESNEHSTDSFLSPLVKKLAMQNNINLDEIKNLAGTGAGGRFSKDDLLNYIQSKSGHSVLQETPDIAKHAPVKSPAPEQSGKELKINEWLEDGSKIVPMNGMRKAIAKHMVHSKQTSPHVYTVQEADVSKISKWRAQHKNDFKKKEGFNLSFTPFFLFAAIKALEEFPIVNASVSDNNIIYHKSVNLGCAVALGNSGLIVPVIKKAEEKNLVGIARSLNDLALRARDKKLLPDEVTNGTFTVTNPGIFGTLIGTPIINQPQSAILCLGSIEKRPVVVDDMIAIRDRCYLTLSYDHRIIDGSVSAQFLASICKFLEDWDTDYKL